MNFFVQICMALKHMHSTVCGATHTLSSDVEPSVDGCAVKTLVEVVEAHHTQSLRGLPWKGNRARKSKRHECASKQIKWNRIMGNDRMREEKNNNKYAEFGAMEIQTKHKEKGQK